MQIHDPGSDKTGTYYNPPTVDQLEYIQDLLEEIADDSLDWLMVVVRADDGTLSQMSIEFWTQNYGRANDLIQTMEETIREKTIRENESRTS